MVFFSESLQNKRSRNEDSCCHMDLKMNHEATVSAFAVADGMGGLSAGNLYSKTAISIWYQELVNILMSEEFKDCSLETQIDSLKAFCQDIFDKINQRLYKKGMDAGLKGGTTLTTAIHFWDTWIFANCGDSPIYVMRKDKLELISEIQNLAWQLVKEGKTQIGSTLFLQNKNRLLEYLGRRQETRPHLVCLEGDQVQCVLMGSDGAFGNIRQGHLEKMIKDKRDKSQILSTILEYARNLGENDNQTAFLIFPPPRKMETSPDQNKAVTVVEGRDFIPLEEIRPGIPDDMIRPAEENLRTLSPDKGLGIMQEEEPARFRAVKEESLKSRFLKMFAKGREED